MRNSEFLCRISHPKPQFMQNSPSYCMCWGIYLKTVMHSTEVNGESSHYLPPQPLKPNLLTLGAYQTSLSKIEHWPSFFFSRRLAFERVFWAASAIWGSKTESATIQSNMMNRYSPITLEKEDFSEPSMSVFPYKYVANILKRIWTYS